MFGKREGVTDEGQNVKDFDPPSMSPEDTAAHYTGMVANSLESTGLFQVVDMTHRIGELQIMGRVSPKDEKEFVRGVLKELLTKTRGTCELFVGKQFLIDKVSGELKYAWVFACGSDDLQKASMMICSVIGDHVGPKYTEAFDIPLLGSGSPEGSVVGGKKGASAVKWGG